MAALDPREEAILGDALEALDGGLAPDPGDREALELWGVLAHALEPAALAPGARARLLARLAQAEAGPSPVPLSHHATPRPTSWPRLALAATVVVALGLGVLVVATWGENRRLTGRTALLESRLEGESRARRAAEVELAGARDRLALVTNTSTEICALTPPTQGGAAGALLTSGARGVLWIAADHQHWHLSVEGLEAVEGSEFEVWFLVGDERTTVSAGTFRPRAGERITLSSPEMPAGTRAVAITLEPIDRDGEPQGPTVLFGDEVRRMI